MRSARVLLTGIVDYAGLFPPASLEMSDAVALYASYVTGPELDLLGRFVLPATRLDEFAEVAGDRLPHGENSEPWRLSAVLSAVPSAGATEARERVLAFNCSHWNSSELGHALCDAIEMPVASRGEIEAALETFPVFFELFLEVPISADPEPLIAAMAGTRARAKSRTGGVTENAIPATGDVLRFMKACHLHRVAFKATAGLHHAMRAEYPLTYEQESPRAEMLGYINVFLAAAFLAAGLTDDEIVKILEERDATAFRFGDAGVSWRGRNLSVDQLDRTRRDFALSYGSCSFADPVAEAKELGLI